MTVNRAQARERRRPCTERTVAEHNRNFLTDIIDADLDAGRHDQVTTRFPPEPNGYLHIGHAKSICLNHGLARRYDGRFNLRFDDTNPVAEKDEFVQAIVRDVRWLIGEPEFDRIFWASDYFEWLYERALELVDKGLAYVDSQSTAEVRENRGDFNTPGTPSRYRDRTVEENRDLLARMKAGEFGDGEHTLRAKIDMAHPNMVMRDPLLYRIKHAHHHNTGDAWCIYPMYDFAHCLEDAYEGISHSICTLEFENNRAIYDWLIENVTWDRTGTAKTPPRQYEFARLALDYTMTSKRKLKQLVEDGHVDGWDDPRMPTLAGMRRGGIRPEALRAFCELVGVAKTNSTVDYAKFDFAVRQDLNPICPRALAVLEPLPVTLTDVDDDFEEVFEAPLFPDDPESTSRPLRLRKHLLIERSDFMAEPVDGFRRLAPGRTVRLRYAHSIRCDAVETDDAGEVIGLSCSLVRDAADASGIIHWLATDDAVPAEVRVYDRLFSTAAPGTDPDRSFVEELNPASLVTHAAARVEPWVAEQARADDAFDGDAPNLRVQFERTGYFCPDAKADGLVFNRIVALKDAWANQQEDAEGDLDARRAEKEAEKAAQAARSEQTRRTPAEVAAERGEDVESRFTRLVGAGAPPSPALAIASANDQATAYLMETAAFASYPADAAKYLVNFTLPAWDDAPPYPAEAFSGFASDLASDAVPGNVAKALHAAMLSSGRYDRDAVQTVGGDAIADAVASVLAAEADAVARYRDGKTQLLGFFIGKVMQAAGKGADAGAVRKTLLEQLG